MDFSDVTARIRTTLRPAGGADAGQMIREGRAAVAAIEARRQDRASRNAVQRERGREVYEATRAAHEAAQGFPGVPIAASLGLWDDPPPITIC